MKRKSVLFITGHHDDVAFACGGTAWLLKKHYDLHVLCMTKGERGYHDALQRGENVTKLPPSPEIAATRAAEEKASCDLLSASLRFMGQIDGEIFPERVLCEEIAEIIKDLSPAAILTHGPFEKKDHNATFAATYQALQLSGRFWETELCCFFQQSETYSRQLPPILVNSDDVIEHKKELVACHRSHLDEHCTIDSVIERNQIMGKLTFCDYAEGFLSPFSMVNQRWNRKAECGHILLNLPDAIH